MRFACCTEEIEISGIRRCFESAKPGSVNLGLGQPDFDTPAHIKRAAIKAIEMGQCGYTSNCGVSIICGHIFKTVFLVYGISISEEYYLCIDKWCQSIKYPSFSSPLFSYP